MLALVARILVSSNVVPGPTVEASVLNVGNVIGREIIAEFVALINGGPEFAGLWVDGNTYCIADTPRVKHAAGSHRGSPPRCPPGEIQWDCCRYRRRSTVIRPIRTSSSHPEKTQCRASSVPLRAATRRPGGWAQSLPADRGPSGLRFGMGSERRSRYSQKKRIWGWPLGDRKQCQKAA